MYLFRFRFFIFFLLSLNVNKIEYSNVIDDFNYLLAILLLLFIVNKNGSEHYVLLQVFDFV